MTHLAMTLIKTDKLYKISNISEILFPTIETNSIKYSPDVLLEDDQIYHLENFSSTDYCLEILKKIINTTDYNEFNNSDCDNKKEYLINIDTSKNVFYFQKITGALLKPKRFLNFVGESETRYEIIEQGKSISLKNKADAVYIKNEDKLYFKKLETIKTIFNNIEELYREATESEVDDFLKLDFIQCNIEINSVKTQNRKRIALLKDKYDSFDEYQKQNLKKYIHEYEVDLPFENDRFTVNSDQDLKKLLYGIDQRYYTTAIEHERRIANSVIKMSND